MRSTNGLPISRFAVLLRLDTRFGAPQQSLIAKKLQFRAFFCFLGSQDSLERRSGMNLGPACEQSGPGSAAGAFGRALGGVPGMQCWVALGTGLLSGVVEWHRACATNEGLGFMPGA